MSSSKVAEQLGAYRLEQRLAAGGMAEVFLARGTDPNGQPRWCVVKRMLSHIAADPHFVTMFLDEAKLVAQLHHTGIAQLYDVGQEGDVLFLAMEYVAGATLRGIVKDRARRGERIGVRHAVEIIARAADALDYAHHAVDLSQRPLNLIHRDVSPQNILLSVQGDVKLIDFGVAKAATASQVTAQGIIKGKFPYMSPEQIRGQPLDARSDLFGLGLVMYELLAGHRAITGATDAEITENALAMRFDPIEKARRDTPPALAKILGRALDRERKKRHPSAATFAVELRAWLAQQGPTVTSAELAALLPQMDAGLQPTGSMPTPPPTSAPRLPPAAPIADLADTAIRPAPVAATLAPAGKPDAAPTVAPAAARLAPNRTPDASMGPTGVIDASMKPTAMVEGDELQALLGSVAPPLPPVAPQQLRVPDGPGEGSGSRLRRAVRAATLPWILSAGVLAGGLLVLALAVYSRSGIERTVPTTPAPPVSPPATLVVAPPVTPVPPVAPTLPTPTPSPEVPAAAVPVLSLSATPVAAVSVNGKPVGRTPLELALAPGEHTLLFEDPKTGLRQTRKVTMKPGENRSEAWRRGQVSVRVVPWGEVFVDGTSVGVTPLAPLELAAGRHRIKVVNPETQKEQAREVDVPAGAETVLKFDLR